jgi:hypothetical protein
MTEAEMKFHDAVTQFELAKAHHHDEQVVRSCINAVIDHGRSVTFVMQSESGAVGLPLRNWYDDQMKLLLASPRGGLLRFFNDRRVYTTHTGVVRPQLMSAEATHVNRNGVMVPVSAGTTVKWYRFEGVREYIPTDSSGGAFRLCEQYLSLLRGLMDGWLAKRVELGIQ